MNKWEQVAEAVCQAVEGALLQDVLDVVHQWVACHAVVNLIVVVLAVVQDHACQTVEVAFQTAVNVLQDVAHQTVDLAAPCQAVTPVKVAAPAAHYQPVLNATHVKVAAMVVEVATHVVDAQGVVQAAYHLVVLLDAVVVHHACQAVVDVVTVVHAKRFVAVEIIPKIL